MSPSALLVELFLALAGLGLATGCLTSLGPDDPRSCQICHALRGAR